MPQQLLHGFLVVRLDLRDHVARDEAQPGTGFPTVEAIGVFITIDLEPWGQSEAEMGRVRKGHGTRFCVLGSPHVCPTIP